MLSATRKVGSSIESVHIAITFIQKARLATTQLAHLGIRETRSQKKSAENAKNIDSAH